MSVVERAISRVSPATWRRAGYFGLWGAAGGFAGAWLGEFLHFRDQWATFIEAMVDVGIWFGVIGGFIAAAILLGHIKYSARSLSAAIAGPNLRRLTLGGVFGVMSGFIAGAVAQGLYTGIGPTEVLRAICWGVAGGLLGITLSFRIPNLTAIRGLAGGFAGGIVGGIIFIGVSVSGSEVTGRLIGIAIIGFAIGLMIMLADALFRKAWLEVRYGPRETRTLTLGSEPLRVGSDAGQCAIYVKSMPAIAYAYRFEAGRVICDDRISNRSGPVPFGVPMTVDGVMLTPFGAGMQNASGVAAEPAYASGEDVAWVLSVGGREFPLAEGVRLAIGEIRGLAPADKDGQVAEVVRNPENLAVVGLKNLSRQRWKATFASGRGVEIDPDRSLRLEPGTRIDFGEVEGSIRSGDRGSAFSHFWATQTARELLRRVRVYGEKWGVGRWATVVIAVLAAILLIAVIWPRGHPPMQNDNTEEIKLESNGNTYQLRVTLNDTIKMNFTLDTGASDVLIPAEVALTLLTSGTLSKSDFIGYQTYKLADGSTLPSAQFKLRDIELGDRRVTDVTASVGPVGSLPLLGQSFLSRLGTWTIDNRHKVLRIAR